MVIDAIIYRCPGCNLVFAVEDDVSVSGLVCPRLRCNCSLDVVAIDSVKIYAADEKEGETDG